MLDGETISISDFMTYFALGNLSFNYPVSSDSSSSILLSFKISKKKLHSIEIFQVHTKC